MRIVSDRAQSKLNRKRWHSEFMLFPKKTANRKIPLTMNALKLIAALSMFAPIIAHAATFDFGYNSVFDSQASDHDFSVNGLQKYNEGGNGVTYWGPSAANQMGTLIMLFSYPTATQSIYLNAESEAYNFGGGNSGQSYLDASTDGVNYTNLINNPTTGNLTSLKTYNGFLPAQLLGSTTLYLRIQIAETSYPGSFAYGQVSRHNTGVQGDIFEVTATTAPEPTSVVLIACGALLVGCRRKSKRAPIQ